MAFAAVIRMASASSARMRVPSRSKSRTTARAVLVSNVPYPAASKVRVEDDGGYDARLSPTWRGLLKYLASLGVSFTECFFTRPDREAHGARPRSHAPDRAGRRSTTSARCAPASPVAASGRHRDARARHLRRRSPAGRCSGRTGRVGTTRHRAQPRGSVAISDLVVGESYFALRHHYDVPHARAVAALAALLADTSIRSTGVAAQVLAQSPHRESGSGHMDRLLHAAYQDDDIAVLTFDRAAARLPGAQLLTT